MMFCRYICFFLFVYTFQFGYAQNVILTKVKEISENQDKFLYKIDSAVSGAQYLGEIEVQGFSADDAEVFGKIYAKAKEIGANAYSFLPFETIDGRVELLDPAYYRMNLYYLHKNLFPKETNIIYIINSTAKTKKVSFNDEIIELPSRSFVRRQLKDQELYTLSTRKFLGTSVQLKAKENQPVQFFQIEPARIKANPYGTAGVNLKSGDLILLEKSYGQFLSFLYKEI